MLSSVSQICGPFPGDQGVKWHHNALIQIEYSQLETISTVLLRLMPKFLALTGNLITEVPPEIFEIPRLRTLGLGSLDIQELPAQRDKSFSNTQLSFLGFDQYLLFLTLGGRAHYVRRVRVLGRYRLSILY
ncbi:unnamed protein product [Phytophthora fragariaefolia]|uniref:Unnamed protein product n=1 Tax=Phytophthora fragariaefolia TaxID=1490495 RepID=A0A9W7CZ13_9STRA|nr:unnamed protein product [Phytophthora fragariaefolia]